MPPWVYEADDEFGTERLAAALAAELPDRTVVALNGPLGAGKTHLVRQFAKADGADPAAVVSPTFVLVQQYQGRRVIYHFDAYRLADDDEFLQLGPDECFAEAGVSFVEWADRVARCLPADRLEIAIEVTGPTARRFSLLGRGSDCEQVVERLRRRLGERP